MTRELQDKAKEHMQRNEWEHALVYLEKAQEIEPQNSYVLGPLGFCYSRLGRHQRAIAIFEQLCQLLPDEARWHYMLGYQYYDQQNYRESLPHFDRALELEPLYIVVWYRKGYALSTMEGERGHALTAFERCREAYHKLPDGEAKQRECKNYADACYQQGKLFLDAHNYRLAQQRLQEAVALKSDDADAHYSLGKCCLETKQFREAVEVLEKANQLAAQPQHYIVDRLARAYAGLGQLERAVAIYEQSPFSVRSRAYILRNLGDLYIQMEQWKQAERVLSDAVGKEYRNHNGHYSLGISYRALGKWQRAADEFEKAIQLRKKHYQLDFPDAQQALSALLVEHPEVKQQHQSEGVRSPFSLTGRPVGRVKRYFDKGYGFLAVEGQKDDLFFHITQVHGRDSVEEGEYLEYDLGEGRDGRPAAVNLRVIAE
jgi:tetratricopeptide (TPR) repeat protein